MTIWERGESGTWGGEGNALNLLESYVAFALEIIILLEIVLLSVWRVFYLP